MRISFVYPIFGAALLACAQPGLAENASVIIRSPADGALLPAMAEHRGGYEVTPAPLGEHTHLYVDNKEMAVLRQHKGSHALAGLAAGVGSATRQRR